MKITYPHCHVTFAAQLHEVANAGDGYWVYVLNILSLRQRHECL